MSVLYDKKLIIHVSLEIVLMGSMAYFFHNRSKAFENRLYDTESRLASLERQLMTQKEELQVLKKIKHATPIPTPPTPTLSSVSDNDYKAFKKFQEEQARIASQTTATEPAQKFTRPVFTPAMVEVIEVEVEADPLQLSLTTSHTPPPSLNDLDKEIESELNELTELI
jgi:hypothetical protein